MTELREREIQRWLDEFCDVTLNTSHLQRAIFRNINSRCTFAFVYDTGILETSPVTEVELEIDKVQFFNMLVNSLFDVVKLYYFAR